MGAGLFIQGLAILDKVLVIHACWEGEATVQVFPANKSLVINQTGAVHGKIRELVDDVRDLAHNRE